MGVADCTQADVNEVIEQMESGIDVLYQPTLSDGGWSGRADFLRRVATPSRFGNWSYEAYDTKLARETRAGTILQLSVYSSLLEAIQNTRPEHMHVVTPGRDFEPLTYRVDDYGAYYRLLARDMVDFLKREDETYPERVTHCDYCRWWVDCERRRRADDDLCYVAGISRGQIVGLRELGVAGLAELAALDPVPKPDRGSRDALVRVRDQARVQLVGRNADRPHHELREPVDDEHGLALLPEPSPGDIFLDFEGDHFAEDGVREYLLGYVVADGAGRRKHTALWATTPEQERRNFETFIDLATATRTSDPGAHIYHFAPYETAALKRLMGLYATREAELDALLRGRAFVDLHKVVKRSLLASVERYSIKDLEPFFGYVRAQDLREASQSRRMVETAVAEGSLDADDPHRSIVEDYNREDCESTSRLRDWLERERAEAVSAGHCLPRPDVEGGEAPEAVNDLDQALWSVRDGLLEGVPDDLHERTEEQHARFALAHMMEFHRREEKANWWEYFRLRDLDEDDLLGERRAIGGLAFQAPAPSKRAPVHRYTFAEQDVDIREGDTVYDLCGEDLSDRLGSVVSADHRAHTVDIRKGEEQATKHPTAVVLHNHVGAGALRNALLDFGRLVLQNGFALGDPYCATTNLLLRRAPPGAGFRRDGEDVGSAACRIACALDGGVLAIQGPPGTGKTYTGGEIICDLVAQGRRVGVTAVSHKVIVNLLESAAERAAQRGMAIETVHRDRGQYEGAYSIKRTDSYPRIRKALAAGEIQLLGGTPWCWTRPEFKQSVDVLVVDEAGQMSLANVLAASRAGRSIILLGDPQQLEQPLQSSHPPGSEMSALSHWLDGEETMPSDRGLFLGTTYRLHPEIAKFTSEAYYQGKVEALPDLASQRVVARADHRPALVGAGLRYVPVEHTGNQARCRQEADVIAGLVAQLTGECDWTDKGGVTRPLREDDILVVAPYNAQVAELTAALPDGMDGRIGTVDRFQGQEAPVVIYSMTSSSADDAPRGMEFLYNRFRFNVATSRARALCVLVGSPSLFRPECRTPAQMRMVNGLCRYRELAQVIDV